MSWAATACRIRCDTLRPLACDCDPSSLTGCGLDETCHIGGCRKPTSTKWGYCKKVGGGTGTLSPFNEYTTPGGSRP